MQGRRYRRDHHGHPLGLWRRQLPLLLDGHVHALRHTLGRGGHRAEAGPDDGHDRSEEEAGGAGGEGGGGPEEVGGGPRGRGVVGQDEEPRRLHGQPGNARKYTAAQAGHSGERR